MIDFNKETSFNDLTHDMLKEHANSCDQCQLADERTNVVFNSGNTNAELMLIGEGPGQQEDEEGIPFIGRAGKLLTKILESVDIHRDDIYIANTVKCRPPNNRTPLPDEMTACQDYLIRQIQLVQPKIICLLGAAAVKAILGPTNTISKIRGQWITIPVNYMSDDLYIMPMFHPSYLLRNSSKEKGAPKWLTWNDMKEVKAALSFYDIMSKQ
ncbi:uracil-DNA glycosylase [Candidatus Marinamargulisbacteria bacterium SCGC AG-343-K17]|nr:uracil-DNA glycosylase [Candidatus Marinamargulisbacteria bacterium SCGC AG-343-K17]